MPFSEAPRGWLRGVTAGTADLSAGAVTAAKVSAGTLTATQLSAGTVTATQLAANAVTTAKVSAGTLIAADVSAGTFTATQLSAGTVTNAKLSAIDNATLNNPAKIVLGARVLLVVAGSHILGYAPQAGTLDVVGAGIRRVPTSGNIKYRFYCATNASQLWTSGLVTAAAGGVEIASGDDNYGRQQSTATAYSTVAAGHIIACTISLAGSGYAGPGYLQAEITPS